MALSKEVKIGALVAISLLVFFAGFYFLRGSSLFSSEKEYYAYYDNVQGLQSSAAVQVKGLAVGRVASIELVDSDKVRVIMTVDKDVVVPIGSSAELASADLLGTKVIKLKLGSGTQMIEDGGTLPGAIEGGIIDNLSSELSPLITDLRHVIITLDTVLIGVSGVLNENTANSLANTVTSLDVTMKNFSELSGKLNRESEQLASIIRNANSISTNLANNNQSIENIIKNAEKTTNNLSGAPIQETVKELESAAKQLDGILQKINNNEGSLGMVVNDKQLYNNLTMTMKSLNELMADINARPWRYINVTIFGRKRKD